MTRKVFVVHYSEIGLKGANRVFFERKLVENINYKIKSLGGSAKRRSGRILVELKEDSNINAIKEALRTTPGIRYFALAEIAPLDLDKIAETCLLVLKDKEFGSFKVSTSRSNKNFPHNSVEVNRIVGEKIVKSTGKSVNLAQPDVVVHIEICEKEAYVYTERVDGTGGLPVSVSGKVISLLSGGIDSPVAAFLLMKRGCKVVFVHFFNQTIHSREVRRKIEEIVRVLAKYQGRSKLYMVDFGDAQREIIKLVPAKCRMIIYRRFMMRIACEIARKEGAKALVTGDNVAQVASQTLDNLAVIYEASRLPVLTPLAGFDKEETINLARKIGTYEISIRPYPDCCSLMIAKHPETRSKLDTVVKIENIMNTEDLVEKALKNTEVLIIDPREKTQESL